MVPSTEENSIVLNIVNEKSIFAHGYVRCMSLSECSSARVVSYVITEQLHLDPNDPEDPEDYRSFGM